MKIYRVICYDIPDSQVGERWIEITLRRSIYGQYAMPNGATITATQITPEEIANSAHGALNAAATRPWPPRVWPTAGLVRDDA